MSFYKSFYKRTGHKKIRLKLLFTLLLLPWFATAEVIQMDDQELAEKTVILPKTNKVESIDQDLENIEKQQRFLSTAVQPISPMLILQPSEQQPAERGLSTTQQQFMHSIIDALGNTRNPR